MAHNISNASLEGIYDRLNNAPEYHPLDANTFADWSVEAGDMVTVSRGSESYSAPVHTAKLVWKGAPEVTLSSTGNKERDPVSKMSRKKYGRGGTAVRSQEQIYYEFTSSDGYLHSAIYMSESVLRTEFDSAISDVHSTIIQTAEQIYSEVYASDSMLFSYVDQTATYISSHVEDVANSLGSEILQTASQIRAEVHASDSALYSYVDQTATYIQAVVEDTANSLGSAILQTANEIRSEVHASDSALYSYVDQTATYIRSEVHDSVSGLYSYVDQTASGIRQEVANTASGLQSSINQTAGKVDIIVEGTGANTHIKPAAIQAAIDSATGSSKITLSADNIVLDGDAVANSLLSHELTVGDVTCDGLTVYSDVAIMNDEGLSVNGNVMNVADIVVGDNNTVTIYYVDGSERSFSKAASINSLVGSWSGSTLTVSTDPSTGKTYTVGLNSSLLSSDTNLSVLSNGTPSISASNEKYVDAPLKIVTVSSGTPPTTTTRYEFVMPINATSAWNAGNVAGQSAGAADVKLYPEWDVNIPNKLTISKTTGESYGTSYTLYVVAGLDDLTYNSTTHKYTTTAHAKAGVSAASATDRSTESKTSGTEAYSAGKASVTLNDPTWNAISGDLPSNRTVTVSTSGRTTASGTTENLSKDVSLYLTQGSWSSNSLTVSMRTGSSSGTAVAKTVVSAPTPTVNTWSLNYQSAPYSYTASVKVNGTTYTSGTLNATSAYANGWTGCYNGIEVSPSSFSTLNYGQTYTVYAKAYQSSSATSKSNAASVSFTVPADRYNTGYNAAHVSGAWSTNTFSYQKTTAGSANSDSFTVNTAVAMQQGECYTYATWVSAAQTTPSVIGGTSKKLTIVNVDDNTVKLQAAGSNTGLTFAHNKWSGAYATFKQETTSNLSNLDYGQSVTITAKARASSSATEDTTISTLTYNAPADNWPAAFATFYQEASSLVSALNYGQSVTITAKGRATRTATSDTTISSVTYVAPEDRFWTGWHQGNDAAGIESEFSWSTRPVTGNTNPSSNYNQIRISTTGKDSNIQRKLDLYLDSGSWSSGSRSITLYYTKNNTTYKVSKTTVSNTSWTFGSISGYSDSKSHDVERTVSTGYKYWTFTVSVNGQSKTVQIVVSS